MTILPEQLAAYADGELDEVAATRVQYAVENDPELARELGRLVALRLALAARFDPILTEPVPERLINVIEDAGKVINLSDVRAERQTMWQRPQFRLGAGAAIAASLIVALLVGGRGGTPQGYADTQLTAALDGALSGETGADGTRLLISFRDRNGAACRGYSGLEASGIACRDDHGWKLNMLDGSAAQHTTEYQQAASENASIMAAAQNMAAGPALDAAAEKDARDAGWTAKL